MGGKTASAIEPRKHLFVLNLTQDCKIVQFSSVQSVIFSKIFSLNYINSNELPALTPPRPVAIISVSVRSAELRLELYV
jgi:hypothetical protein